mmetsp:Transcript_24760/g.53841  ORF Transcript_24760/g.53841 Transcript_24760/m.53841 type:complete len:204 (-) Transcript_24760:157-768(-)
MIALLRCEGLFDAVEVVLHIGAIFQKSIGEVLHHQHLLTFRHALRQVRKAAIRSIVATHDKDRDVAWLNVGGCYMHRRGVAPSETRQVDKPQPVLEILMEHLHVNRFVVECLLVCFVNAAVHRQALEEVHVVVVVCIGYQPCHVRRVFCQRHLQGFPSFAESSFELHLLLPRLLNLCQHTWSSSSNSLRFEIDRKSQQEIDHC